MNFPARAELKAFDGIFTSSCHHLCMCCSFVLVLYCYHQIPGCCISTWDEFCSLYSQFQCSNVCRGVQFRSDCLRHKMLLPQSCTLITEDLHGFGIHGLMQLPQQFSISLAPHAVSSVVSRGTYLMPLCIHR